MTRFMIIASVFALAAPAALAAPPTVQQSAQATTPSGAELCKQQRRTIGMDAFRALYAPTGSPKAAMDECLKTQKLIAGIAAKNAAKACKAEQDANPTTFASTYGKNANDKNAFGKCVSLKAKENVESQQQATLNAAKTCKAERAKDAAKFKNDYGTNKNKANAFGKCVAELASGQSD